MLISGVTIQFFSADTIRYVVKLFVIRYIFTIAISTNWYRDIDFLTIRYDKVLIRYIYGLHHITILIF